MWSNCRIIICFLFLASLSIQLMASGYEIPVTRNNKTIKLVAYNAWLSEYPAPVINVFTKKAGTTTVMAFDSLRNPVKKIPCTIKNGLYHPWANKNSSILFYTLTDYSKHKAITKTQLGEKTLNKNTIVSFVHGLSEGYCAGKIMNHKNPKDIVFFCSDIESPAFKTIKNQHDFSEQWIYLKCEEGYKAFIEDKSLLKHKGVVTGKIIQYGVVAP